MSFLSEGTKRVASVLTRLRKLTSKSNLLLNLTLCGLIW